MLWDNLCTTDCTSYHCQGEIIWNIKKMLNTKLSNDRLQTRSGNIFPNLEQQVLVIKLQPPCKTLISSSENTRHSHNYFLLLLLWKNPYKYQSIGSSPLLSVSKEQVKLLFLVWSSSLVIFSSKANKLHNPPASFKHLLHVLQVLEWQGNIRSNTKSKNSVKTHNTLSPSPCARSRRPHSERTKLRSFQLHSPHSATKGKVASIFFPFG